ncbi:MAG: pyruvate kinase [Actinomycetota bacterium]
MERRTKIVATLGPATRDPVKLEPLICAGVDVVRLNFAHETPENHTRTAAAARRIAAANHRSVGLLVDLPGPKMRTGPIEGDEVELDAGRPFVLTGRPVQGDDQRVSASVGDLAAMVAEGDEIYLADGEIVLRVVSIDGTDVHTETLSHGILRSRKGMHIPSAERHVRAFTDADRAAAAVALKIKANFIGLSFIRDADDLRRARETFPKRGHRPHLVAKIETRSALDNLSDIVDEADAVMVARGDLGIQTPLRRVPLLQKQIIQLCNSRGIPVITATQMLESMTHSPLPTRAEVTDIANAVLDGTDALMLSEETAVGDYPVATVETMAEIAQASEEEAREHARPEAPDMHDDRVSWAVAHAGVAAAEDLRVKAILCPTRTGSTARRVAAFRPSMPIVGLSSREQTLGTMAMNWGVLPLATADLPEARDMREETDRAVAAARAAGLLDSDGLVAVVAGSPGPRAGRTDFMRVVRC